MAYQVDEHTVSLLHFDDGITDETGKTWTSDGDISYSSDIKKLGTKSIYFNNGVLTYKDSNQQFVLDTNDFTIECYIYITSESTRYGMPILGNYTYAADGYTSHAGWALAVNRSQVDNYGPYGLSFAAFDSSGTEIIGLRYPTMLTSNVWHHIAVVRNQDKFYMFLDGSLVESLTSSASINCPKPYTYIGNYNNSNGTLYSQSAFYGYIDELRISNVARWTKDFDPGNDPTPTPSTGNKLLRVTMNDSSEREYRVSDLEVDSFVKWYDRTVNTGNTCYTFNDSVDGSKEYLSFEKIISFKVIPLAK